MILLTYDPYAAPLVTDLLDEAVVLQGLEITVHRGSRYVNLTGGLIYIDEVAVTDHRIYGQFIGWETYVRIHNFPIGRIWMRMYHICIIYVSRMYHRVSNV